MFSVYWRYTTPFTNNHRCSHIWLVSYLDNVNVNMFSVNSDRQIDFLFSINDQPEEKAKLSFSMSVYGSATVNQTRNCHYVWSTIDYYTDIRSDNTDLQYEGKETYLSLISVHYMVSQQIIFVDYTLYVNMRRILYTECLQCRVSMMVYERK